MRKIEEQLLNAIKNKTNWRKNNTQVSFENNKGYVYLHGNKIVVLNYKEDNLVSITLYNSGYYTTTTKSRLNTILNLATNQEKNTVTHYSIYQKDYIWYLSTSTFIKGSNESPIYNSTTFTQGLTIKLDV